MRAGPVCVVFAGMTQASSVMASFAGIAVFNLVAAPADEISVAAFTLSEPAPQLTLAGSAMVRSIGVPISDTSNTVLPLPASKVYSACNPAETLAAGDARTTFVESVVAASNGI